MPSGRSLIPGTEHALRPGEHTVSAAQPEQLVTVSIYLRRPTTGAAPSADDLLSGRAEPMDRGAAEAALEASPADLSLVEDFLRSEGLRVIQEDPAARRIQAQGTAAQMDHAFGVQLKNAAIGSGLPYLTHDGAITVPVTLAGVVTAVLGLDNRPIATHH